MIRAIAGALQRSGAPDAALIDRLRDAVAAQAPGAPVHTAVSGALALAYTGAQAHQDGAALAVLDGIIDAGIGADDTGDRLGGRHAQAMERAALGCWQPGAEDAFATALRGDHALALWDGARGVLVRDQFGGRSWVLHDDGSRLLFATEAACLLAALRRRPSVDDVAMTHWLVISGLPADRTLYEGVARLPAGHLIELHPGRAATARRYWRPQPPSGPDQRSREEVAGAVRQALTRSLARRCDSGPTTAVQLSGGLDSASVAALAAGLPAGQRPQRAYSATFPDAPSVDESELIAEIAAATGLQSTRMVVRDGSVLAGSLEFLRRWELPPVSPNLFFWTPMLSAAAADGVRVMLDGEGGDELFGLSPYLVADQLARGELRAAVASVRQVTGATPDLGRRTIARFIARYGVAGLAPAGAHALSRRVRPARHYVPPWVSAKSAKAFVASADGGEWKRIEGPRWWANLLQSATRGPGPAALYDHSRQRAAMAGLLPRHPIMDVDLVELVLGAPPQLAFEPVHSRPVLREAVKGLLPDSVRLRASKSSFDAVFHGALAGPDLPLLRALLGAPDARIGAYCDIELVRRELLDPAPPPPGHARMMWAMHCWRLATGELFLAHQEGAGVPQALLLGAGTPAAADVSLLSA